MGRFKFYFTSMHALLLLSSFRLNLAASQPQPLCHDDERSALLQFKQSMVINKSASLGPSAYPKVASWSTEKENSDCCSWDGIKCNEDTGHVIWLDLTSSCLYGSINSTTTLFQLVHLEKLSLSDNNFNSSVIPSQIKNLSSLIHLSLCCSFFSGHIPAELLELSKLKYLDLSHNDKFLLKLQRPGLGNLVENLTNLEVLDLSYINISSSVPHTLTKLSSLKYLSLCECLLQGDFPAEVFRLPNLQFLFLMYNNDLHGYFPKLHNSSILEDLRLRGTKFSGKLPDSVENLKRLSYLDISYCSFSGKIPDSLGNLTNIETLRLSGNPFSGELPTSIGNLASLKTLEIWSCGFSGKLPDSLGNLTQLNYLNIFDNNFSAINSNSLSWLTNLNHLTFLCLSESNIFGEIPSQLMNLTQLTVLDLSYNYQLSGPIPNEINNLIKLQFLSFGSNQLEGSIPPSIFELQNLQVLDLSSNNLSGTVDLDMFLRNLKSLAVIVLSSNKLSLLTKTTANTCLQKFVTIGFRSCNLSEFPFVLHNQDQLRSLDLSSNNIAGQVPGWFLNVSPKGLQYLNLSHNLLTGFEQEFSVLPWAVMNTLDLRSNKLEGALPVPSVSTYSYLVSNNQLTGEIPTRICSLNVLYVLDLSYNNLNGIIPNCLGNFSVRLAVLKLQGNNFHGFIPQTFMNGSNLRMIDFSNNSLQGGVPKSLANCVQLIFLNLGGNQITDVFPSWIGNLPELEVLVLKSNNFHGVIEEPKASFEFPKLRIIDLSNNRFTGNLPSKYMECWNAMKDINASNLTYLHDELTPKIYPQFTHFGSSDYSLTLSNKGTDLEYERLSNLITAILLSNNSFEGEIPASIANLKGLQYLNLSNNNLEGDIPSSLGNLKALESLDLSCNKLSGQIPEQLGEVTTLQVFDVSHNQLTGPIPQGTQLQTFESDWFDGNPGLCGEPLLKKCGNSKVPQEESKPPETQFDFGWIIVLIGYASGTIIGIALGHIFSTRNHEWLAKNFPLQLKTNGRKRRQLATNV